MEYDSTPETLKHVQKVQSRLGQVVQNLENRSQNHDKSKFESPEKEAFDSLGPPEVMAALTYGSEEYKANLRKIKPAIEHHYSVNDHHPEHFKPWTCPLCKKVWTDLDLRLRHEDWLAQGSFERPEVLLDSLIDHAIRQTSLPSEVRQ